MHRLSVAQVAWEDPRIDGELLQLDADDVVLVLTTGGCNVLDRHHFAVTIMAILYACMDLSS